MKPGVHYQDVFPSLLTKPKDTTLCGAASVSPVSLEMVQSTPTIQAAWLAEPPPLCRLFSCKFVQIENIVHKRGSPVLLRCFALAFSLIPLREMFPFKCYLSASFKTSSSPFDKQPGGMARSWLIEQAFQGRGGKRERKRERCSAAASHRQTSAPLMCVFFFPPFTLRG